MKKSLWFALSLSLLLTLAARQQHAASAKSYGPAEPLAALHAHHTNLLPGMSASRSAPITWSPVEVECPICKTKNIFLQWGSYGSYIYQYPSKYQLVFWPYTDGPAWYSCKKCHLTTFMGDFKTIPEDKIQALRDVLKDVKLPPQKERSAEQSMREPPYLELPVSARMLVAEKVYRTLGRSGDDLWSHFYRVLGYHFGVEGKQSEADAARRQALTLTEHLLADKNNEGRRKELLYISGAMRHFLREDAASLRDLEEAGKLTYSDKDSKPEENKGYNDYLSKVIDEYLVMLRKGEGPRTMKDAGDH